MSTATEHTAHGKLDEIAGKIKQTLGEATGNDKIANEGAAQQVKGHVEQAYGTVKGKVDEKVAEFRARHDAEKPAREERAHDIREKVISTAQNVKERINDDLNPHN